MRLKPQLRLTSHVSRSLLSRSKVLHDPWGLGLILPCQGGTADLAASDRVQFYNEVARSKYGAALWRAAERASDLGEQKQKMRLAIEPFKQAMHHSDPAYSARAYYEGSKASWHLWKVDGEVKLHTQSLEWAEKASLCLVRL